MDTICAALVCMKKSKFKLSLPNSQNTEIMPKKKKMKNFFVAFQITQTCLSNSCFE